MIRMDGHKMSKSRGNLVAPSKYIETVGADALRLFHLFVGPPADNMDWTDQTDEVIDGCGRFLDRVWRFTVDTDDVDTWRQGEPSDDDVALARATHRLVAKVGDAFQRWSFNTAVAACMEFTNQAARYRREVPGGPHRATYDEAADRLLLVLAPMTPHLAAEAWVRRHGPDARIHAESWPEFDRELARGTSSSSWWCR